MLELDDSEIARDRRIRMTNLNGGPIPFRVYIAQEEYEERAIVILEQMGHRRAGVPLNGKFDRNSMRLVQRRRQSPLRNKNRFMSGNDVIKRSTFTPDSFLLKLS